MKRVLSVFVFSLAFFAIISAQSLEEATQLYNEGATTLNGGDLQSALISFEKAYTMAKNLGDDGATLVENCKGIIPGIYFRIASNLVNEQKYSEAIEQLKVTIEKSKEYDDPITEMDVLDLLPKLHNQIANNFLSQEKFTEAAAEYKKVTEYDPQNAKAYLSMGIAYSRLNDEAATVVAFEKASELGEKENANKQLSSFFLKKSNDARVAKKNQESMDYAKKSMTYSDNAQANQLYGLAALQLKKHKEAIEGLEAYLAKTPDLKSPNSTYYNLATSYEALGNKDKACGYYKKIVDDKQFGEYAKHKVNNELKCN